jgi:hypothetical protein
MVPRMPRKQHEHHAKNPKPSLAGFDAGRLRRLSEQVPDARTFVVRMWRETRETPRRGSIFRGTVSDVQGAHVASFSSVARLFEFIAGSGGFLLVLRRDNDLTGSGKPDSSSSG